MITKLAHTLLPTTEMQENYFSSTGKHLKGVLSYIDKVYKLDPVKYAALPVRKLIYDASKNSEPEFTPYCFMLWQQSNPKFLISAEMQQEIKKAVFHHWKCNRHHPEFHDPSIKLKNVVDMEDDIPPNKIVDGTPMTDLDIAEMTSDWCAMADDAGISGEKWAKDHIGKHYKFTDDQVKMIYTLIKAITV